MNAAKFPRAMCGKFWGLGWGLVYVAAPYVVALVIAQSTTIKGSWQLAVISVVAALISALASSRIAASPRAFEELCFMRFTF